MTLDFRDHFAISEERLQHFLDIGLEGRDDTFGMLVRRLSILRETIDNLLARRALIETGLVGDKKEMKPIAPTFDNVWFLVRQAHMIRGLQNLTGHAAVDLKEIEIKDDPGW